LDEVKAWLTLNQIDVAALVETRWTYDANWTDGHWHMIHSGAGEHRGKGIMLLISTRLCAASQIQWQLQDSGRLVHVRLNLQPRSLDLLVCYQHTFQPTASCRQARAKWWTLLETVLAGLPSRNGLILFGDFNCSLGASGQNIGTGSFRWRGSLCTGLIHPDAARFQQILRHFALNVLISWSSALGPTFVHGSQANRLDYFCVRQPYADGTARQVRYLWDSPFLHQTDYGHVPMMCTLAKHWIPSFSQHRIQRVTLQQRQVSRQSYLAQDSDWMRFVACTQTQIATHFARDDLTADEFMETLHRDVLQQFCEHFPAGKHKRSPAAWQTALPTLLTKWEHRRCMQRLGMGTLKNLFKGWYHATKYCSLRRAHKKLAYQTRKNLFYDVVAQAEAAARRHDTHKLFQLINRYAPKQPKKQIQLRKDDGQMASPVESAALLNQFVANTWAGPDRLHLRFDSAPGVPFTVQQLERALSLIPSSKAVAKPFSPGTVWRQHASFLAPLLHAKLTVWWASNPPKIPDSWRHGWLFMIPKPSKPPVSPQNLRPLALQEPVGKAIIGLLIQLVMREAYHHLILFPIWGFMEHRSSSDAIRRVSLHCADVRQLLGLHRSTPQHRATGATRHQLYGGLQIFLDLQRAFDSVHRRKLFSRLQNLHISQSLIQLLMAWHENTVYFVQHDQVDSPVAIGRGVRQGCKAAPGLWNLFVILFLHDLMAHVPIQWIQSHLTIYADDFHIGAKFTTAHDFVCFHKTLGIIFWTLRSLELQINPGKSVALLELRGSHSHALRKQLVRRDRDGEKLRIFLPDGDEMQVPIHKSAKYLGMLISYSNFEDASLKHRLSLMNTGFRRLQRWLTGRHCLTINQRYKLWHCCVYPILTYGIFATGLTTVGIQKAQTQITIMLRKLLHDHAFYTRRNNQQALALHRFPSPLHLLHGTAAGLLRTQADRSELLTEHDLAHTITWEHLPELLHRLEQLQATASLETQVHHAYNTPFFQCAQCDFCTENVSVFRRHCTVAHGYQLFRTQFVQQAHFTVNGLPTCKHCHTTFSTWRMFSAHIERGCQVLLTGPTACTAGSSSTRAALGTLNIMQPNMADSAARGLRMITAEELHHLKTQVFGERLLQVIHDREWTKVAADSEICQYLSSRCIICSFHFSRCQELHQHFRLQHPELWEHAPQKAVQLTNIFSDESPCQCCGALFKTHSCPTWSQIAVLLVNGAGLEASQAEPIHEVRRRCELCLHCFQTAAELVQHLQAEHGLQGLSFNASRDSIDGSSACSHCGQLFLTVGGLKSHIVQGRCEHFNPQASAETLAVDALWKQACLDGKFLEVLRVPAVRMRLTIVCQACGKGCQRAADLSLHLQSAHSRLWRQSQRLTLILVDAYYQFQCFCNPTTGTKRGHHICVPFRQLAMAFHRMGTEPFAPTVITDSLLKAIFAETLPRAPQYRLEQALVHRQFAAVWRDSEILTLLRSHCLLCGAQPATSDLALHLREEHFCGHEMFLFYMEQLLPTVFIRMLMIFSAICVSSFTTCRLPCVLMNLWMLEHRLPFHIFGARVLF
jgi:hypothetical protein